VYSACKNCSHVRHTGRPLNARTLDGSYEKTRLSEPGIHRKKQKNCHTEAAPAFDVFGNFANSTSFGITPLSTVSVNSIQSIVTISLS